VDSLLIDRMAAGDHSAVGELYDRHSLLLFGVIVRILNDRAEAEEVLQEVFVQAWTSVHTYHVVLGTPAGWLLGIARNRAIDRVRGTAGRARTVQAAMVPAPVKTPEMLASLTEQQAQIHRALDALPPEHRELIERAYFMGSTQSEMAVELDLPLETVKARIRTGLDSLRRVLDHRPVEQ